MIVRGHGPRAGGRETGGGGWGPGLSPAAFLFATLLFLVGPIFAHGCHTGDHDDEPAFAPPPADVTSAPPPPRR